MHANDARGYRLCASAVWPSVRCGTTKPVYALSSRACQQRYFPLSHKPTQRRSPASPVQAHLCRPSIAYVPLVTHTAWAVSFTVESALHLYLISFIAIKPGSVLDGLAVYTATVVQQGHNSSAIWVA